MNMTMTLQEHYQPNQVNRKFNDKGEKCKFDNSKNSNYRCNTATKCKKGGNNLNLLSQSLLIVSFITYYKWIHFCDSLPGS